MQNIYAYDNNNSNAAEYGRLNTWKTAVDAAPTGWHLPTKEEWEELINAQGGASIAGGKLKETGQRIGIVQILRQQIVHGLLQLAVALEDRMEFIMI